MTAARPRLAKSDLSLDFQPADSLDLNRNCIEPVVRQVRHHDMPARSFTTKADLRAAVEAGFEAYRSRLRSKGDNQPWQTAEGCNH